jgi:hypothetical protein
LFLGILESIGNVVFLVLNSLLNVRCEVVGVSLEIIDVSSPLLDLTVHLVVSGLVLLGNLDGTVGLFNLVASLLINLLLKSSSGILQPLALSLKIRFSFGLLLGSEYVVQLELLVLGLVESICDFIQLVLDTVQHIPKAFLLWLDSSVEVIVCTLSRINLIRVQGTFDYGEDVKLSVEVINHVIEVSLFTTDFANSCLHILLLDLLIDLI